MNKWFVSIALALSLVAAPSIAETKIAVVDMGKIVKEVGQREDLGASLQKEFADRAEEIKRLENDIKATMEKKSKDALMMSAEQKVELDRSLEQKQASYQLKAKALNQDIQRRQHEEQNKLLMKIQNAVNQVAEANGYDMVLARQALMYVKQENDISAKVIAELNK